MTNTPFDVAVWEGNLGEVAWKAWMYALSCPELGGRVVWACLDPEGGVASILLADRSEAGIWVSEFSQDLVGVYVIERGSEIWQFRHDYEFADGLNAEVLRWARVGDLAVVARLGFPRFVAIGWIVEIEPGRFVFDRAFGVALDRDVKVLQVFRPGRDRMRLSKVGDRSDDVGTPIDVLAIVRECDVFRGVRRALRLADSISRAQY